MGALALQLYRLMCNAGYTTKDFSSVFQFLQESERWIFLQAEYTAGEIALFIYFFMSDAMQHPLSTCLAGQFCRAYHNSLHCLMIADCTLGMAFQLSSLIFLGKPYRPGLTIGRYGEELCGSAKAKCVCVCYLRFVVRVSYAAFWMDKNLFANCRYCYSAWCRDSVMFCSIVNY